MMTRGTRRVSISRFRLFNWAHWVGILIGHKLVIPIFMLPLSPRTLFLQVRCRPEWKSPSLHVQIDWQASPWVFAHPSLLLLLLVTAQVLELYTHTNRVQTPEARVDWDLYVILGQLKAQTQIRPRGLRCSSTKVCSCGIWREVLDVRGHVHNKIPLLLHPRPCHSCAVSTPEHRLFGLLLFLLLLILRLLQLWTHQPPLAIGPETETTGLHWTGGGNWMW